MNSPTLNRPIVSDFAKAHSKFALFCAGGRLHCHTGSKMHAKEVARHLKPCENVRLYQLVQAPPGFNMVKKLRHRVPFHAIHYSRADRRVLGQYDNFNQALLDWSRTPRELVPLLYVEIER